MRIGRALRSRAPRGAPPAERHDSWLEQYHGERLRRIDAACAGGEPECFALFRELDVDLWTLLLLGQYDAYPNIRALLPDMPDPALQELWNGASGLTLAAMGAAFYRKLRERFEEHGRVALAGARVLDFGCGWGRLTRFLARDVAPGRLYGCDPAQMILDVCRQTRVPATLARSEFVPERLPFEGPLDLAFAFSVFTHLSEPAHERALRALHAAVAPGGILVVTVRPPAYLHVSPLLRPTAIEPGEARYLFVPHAAQDSHPQYGGGEMTYGETVVTLPYVRERWAPLFELLEVDFLVGDLHQVMLTLRRV
jgi:SAM-dependent methyltransferase